MKSMPMIETKVWYIPYLNILVMDYWDGLKKNHLISDSDYDIGNL